MNDASIDDPSMTVFLLDGDSAVRGSLTRLIEQDGWRVSGFADAAGFLHAYRAGQLGCAVIDLHLPDLDGLQLQQQMRACGIALPVILLAGQGDIRSSVSAIKSGAIDFLAKPVVADALRASVRAAIQACRVHHESILRLSGLTERERGVMMLALEGMANKQIGRQLGISHRTVEIHKARVMVKSGAGSLLELARLVDTAYGGSRG